MTYVITAACIDVKDGACMKACPVDCIYIGGRMMYIHPTECIDCGLCLSVCPVDAIYEDHDIPERFRSFVAVNQEFFGPAVTGWGEPGGAMEKGPTTLDHPDVAAHPSQKPGG
jgi:NAD-dependent dihydropyrimidine dehydrogenase PreA subunit